SPSGRVNVRASQIFCEPKDLVSTSTETSTPTSALLTSARVCGHGHCKLPPGECALLHVDGNRYPGVSYRAGVESSPRSGHCDLCTRGRRRADAPPGACGPPGVRKCRRGGPARCRTAPASGWCVSSLERDGGTGLLELGLGGLGGLLVDLLQESLGSRLDEVLGLLEAQSRDDLADDLDHADLLVAGRLEHDVELVLLGGAGVAAGSRGAGGRDGDRSGCGDLEGLLEQLHELGELEKGHLLEGIEELVVAELRHGGVLSLCPGAVTRPGSVWDLSVLLVLEGAEQARQLRGGRVEQAGGLGLVALEGTGQLREQDLAGLRSEERR